MTSAEPDEAAMRAPSIAGPVVSTLMLSAALPFAVEDRDVSQVFSFIPLKYDRGVDPNQIISPAAKAAILRDFSGG